MKSISTIIYLFLLIEVTHLVQANPNLPAKKSVDPNFPVELVDFTSYEKNPVFSGSGTGTWDQSIRERGYILKENEIGRAHV